MDEDTLSAETSVDSEDYAGEEDAALPEEENEQAFETDEGEAEGETEETGEKEAEPAEPQEEEKPVQPKEERAEFARKRREAEAKEAERKAREQGILDATGGKNPYTNEEIKDSRDIEEFLLMKKIEKNGGDPVTDYAKWLKKEQREVDQNKTDEQKRSDFIDKDRAEFAKSNPDVDLGKLFQDKRFHVFAGKRIGEEPLSDIYTDYIGFISEFEVKAEKEAQKIDAKRKASPGALGSALTPEVPDVEKMPSKEFEKMLERVKGGEKITLPS